MKKMMAVLSVALALPAFSVELVQEKTLSGNEEFFVAEGETVRIEYLDGGGMTLTKTGSGTLEIATVANSKTKIIVSEGVLKGVCPGKMRSDIPGAFYHVDGNDTSGMTLETVNGTNFITRLGDVDGRTMFATNRSGRTKPFIVNDCLNGLSVLDFGNMYFDNERFPAATGSSCMEFAEVRVQRDSFWVWKDVDGVENMAYGKEFLGVTPVCLQNSYYRGYGGNGNHFKFSNVGPPDRFTVAAYVDGEKISSVVNTRVGPGWHLVSYRMPGGDIADSDHATYGASAFGRRPVGSPYGGFKLAEALFFTNTLSDADYKYVNAYLNSKWFGASIDRVIVKSGAHLDLSDTKWNIVSLGRYSESTVSGGENVNAASIFNPDNSYLAVNGTYSVLASEKVIPNLGFTGVGEVCVPAGTATLGNIISANGTLKKSGEGKLELSYLTDGVLGIEVASGEFVYSPLRSSASVLHLDANTGVETELKNGTNFVTRWIDVNGETVNVAKPIVGEGYKHSGNVAIRQPFLKEKGAGDMPLVDFGTIADENHVNGWGAALGFTNPFGGGKDAVPIHNGWLSAFIVWEDRDDVIDMPLVNESPFRGPCLFGQNYVWTRGKGGAGNGFTLMGSDNAAFRNDVIFDGERILTQNVKNHVVSRGLHLWSIKAGTADGLMGASRIGAYMNTKPASTYGGMRFGECIFFRNQIPDAQRAKINAALGVKWFGDERYTLEHEFESVSVAEGSSASFPYADVTAQSLTLSGTVSAKSIAVDRMSVNGGMVDSALKLADGAEISIQGLPDVEAGAFAANQVEFAGSGSVKLGFDSAEKDIVNDIKLISAGGGGENPVRVRGWKVYTSDLKYIGSLCRKADGYYATGIMGLRLVVR